MYKMFYDDMSSSFKDIKPVGNVYGGKVPRGLLVGAKIYMEKHVHVFDEEIPYFIWGRCYQQVLGRFKQDPIGVEHIIQAMECQTFYPDWMAETLFLTKLKKLIELDKAYQVCKNMNIEGANSLLEKMELSLEDLWESIPVF
jgi:hypothetical protein